MSLPVNFTSFGREAGIERRYTLPPLRQILFRQFDGAEGVSSHSVGPVRTGVGSAAPDLFCLLPAAVQTLGADDGQKGRASYSGVVKFTLTDLPGVTPYGLPYVPLKGRHFQQDWVGFLPEGGGPTVYGRDFAHNS